VLLEDWGDIASEIDGDVLELAGRYGVVPHE
jgi:hypothetical protein